MVDLFHNIQSVCSKWEGKTQDNFKNVSPTLVSISPNQKDPPVENIEKQIKKNGINLMRQNWNQGKVTPAPPPPTRSLRTSQLRWRQQETLKYTSANLLTASQLSSFKTEPTVDVISGKRPYVGLCCKKCLTSSRNSYMDDFVRSFGLNNLLLVPTMNMDKGYFVRKFHYLSHVFNCRKIFEYPDVADDVINCDRVGRAIEFTAIEESDENKYPSDMYPMVIKKQLMRANFILRTMKSRVSRNLLSFIQWVVFKLLSRLLMSVQVHKGQLEIVKRASQSSLPLIFIPLHRSHIDYILVTFILVNNKIQAPLVAAGDNLRIPIIGTLLRGLGAFFIKRKMTSSSSKDQVYKAILHSYVERSLCAGHNLEFFIEGGRSRTGKSCIPKGGLLSVIVDTYLDGSIADALIVPVAINYDKIMDGNYVSEQLGNPKEMESLSSIMKAFWRVINSNFGHVRVDFAQPFSLSELIQSIQAEGMGIPRFSLPYLSYSNSQSSACSTINISSDIDSRRQLVKLMAEHITYDATHCMSIMSTNLLAFLLLNKFRQGATKQQVIHSMTWLLDEIRIRGRDVGFSGNARDVIDHALAILGPELIEERKLPLENPVDDEKAQTVVLKPLTELPYVIELAYYSNVVLSLFLMDSIIATSLKALVGDDITVLKDCDSKLIVSRDNLKEKAKTLCNILQFEFILIPFCSDLEMTLTNAIEKFISKEILSPVETTNFPRRHWGRSLDWDSEDEEEIYIDQNLKVNLMEDTLDQLNFYSKVLSPLIESYWLFACNLSLLIQAQMEEKEFLKRAQVSISNKIAAGLVIHSESLSADALRNAVKLMEQWKVVETCVHQDIKLIYLTENYDDESRLVEIIETIGEFKH